MKKALFVIDVQNCFINAETTHVPARIRHYIESHKSSFDLIIFTNFVNTPQSSVYQFLNWKKSIIAPDTDIVAELQPLLHYGISISKSVYSAFKVQHIVQALKAKQITDVYLCGIDTDCCVLATAYDAFDLGYKVKLLEDLCMSRAGKYIHKATLAMFKRNVGL